MDSSAPQKSTIAKAISTLLTLYFIGVMAVGWYWSQEPEELSIKAAPNLVDPKGATTGDRVIIGSTSTRTLIAITETLLEKPGGFITNDIAPPGVLLDNMPHWEYGVLIQVRDMSKAMRQAFSRSQSQSTEDTDLAKAESKLHFDNNKWAIPASESLYREGLEHLVAYLERLEDADQHNAQFYARADNLRFWLETVESRLGSLSQRLSASVGQRRLNTDLAGEESALQATPTPDEQYVKTSWFEIDDVFYEARGTTWALIHMLKAIETDFADVLGKKKANVSVQQIIRELEATQQNIMSPIILNGEGFGFLANHSLVMASYISRANAAIIDLRELLAQG